MRNLLILILAVLAGLSARAQVFEAGLALHGDGPGSASLYAGKFWLKAGAQGIADFQVVITSFFDRYTVVSAQVESPASSAVLALSDGVERTYSGCDPLGLNPYLSWSPPFSPITCPALMTGKFYQGQFVLPPGLAADLSAQRGRVRIKLVPPSDPTNTVEITGSLEVTGVINGRQFYLTPVNSVTVSPSGNAIRVTWTSSVGSHYLVQLLTGLGGPVAETAGFTIVATSTSSIIEVPFDGVQQKFVRILRLR